MNLSALEEWVETVNLPRSVLSHLAPVRELLNWLQVSHSDSSYYYRAYHNPLKVLVLYHGVFQSHCNYPDFEAFESLAGKH
jgi:hypothetical protein